MDIRHFITFKSIVDNGSFSSAADKLGYTQSTVTSHIQQLERELNLKLFEKLGRKMVLTSAGKKLLPLANDLLDILVKIGHIGTATGSIAGELKIAAPETLTIYKLEPILREFRQKAPDVKLSIINANCFDIKQRVINGEVDVALIFAPCYENDALIATPLAEIPLTLVSGSNTDISKINLAINDMPLGTSIIVNEPKAIYRTLLEKYLKEKNITPESTIELWSVEAIKKCVKSGLGISLLPDITIAQDLKNGDLRTIPLNSTNLTIVATLAYHKNKWLTPAMELFIKIATKCFENNEV